MSLTNRGMKISVGISLVVALGVSQNVVAQEGQSSDPKLLISSAMYEVDGESGLFGMIVSVTDKMARFKPCYGPELQIAQERLRSTKFTCEDAPTPYPNPLVVTCIETDAMWDEVKALATAEMKRTGGVSSEAHVAADGKITLHDVPKDTVEKIMKAVSQFKNCGQWTVGYSIQGEPIVHVLHSEATLDTEIRRQ